MSRRIWVAWVAAGALSVAVGCSGSTPAPPPKKEPTPEKPAPPAPDGKKAVGFN